MGIDSLLVINKESPETAADKKISSLQNFEPPSSWCTDRMVVCWSGLEHHDHVLPRGKRDEILHAALHLHERCSLDAPNAQPKSP